MDDQLERVYARWCARSVLHLWDAPVVVRQWVDTGEEDLRDAAGDAAAGDAARDAAGDAAWAAWAAAGDAAAGDAAEAAWAAWAAARAAAGDAARDAARDAAGDAALAKQSSTRDLLGILPDLLRIHGLAARLLDDVREDAWLTREVARALALPDLAAWCDWCKQMEVE